LGRHEQIITEAVWLEVLAPGRQHPHCRAAPWAATEACGGFGMGDGGGMSWKRLDSAVVARALRAAWDAPAPDGDVVAAEVLAHMREQLLGGHFVAVQDHLGQIFIGTPEEAAEHMMETGQR